MLVTIGILILILLIIVIFYQDLISERIKVEDAQEALQQHLFEEYSLNAESLPGKMQEWSESGMKLSKKTVFLFEKVSYATERFNRKLKVFPYSVLGELFKVRRIDY